jgi:biopolymer transport protein ExbD
MEIPSTRPKRHARIEIIPLIDIMFFLLATFVMVSLSMIKNRGVSVNLPPSESGAVEERKDSVVISITDTGQFFLDRSEIEFGPLVDALKRLQEDNPRLRVFINGDQNARLGLAIHLLDEVRRLGISKVSFETRPAKNSDSK